MKNTYTRRYNKDEYFQLSRELIAQLENCFPTYHFEVIPAYKEKETFGDMDILYCPKFSNSNVAGISSKFIHANFLPNEVVVSGACMSFDQHEFQIDLIFSTKEEFDYALGYFAGVDCGNLVGKLTRRFGMKHGHDGLFLPIRDGDYLVTELLLTRDIRKTYEFLKLDADKAESGFNNLDEIFQFIASSPYYDPELYKLENLNNVAKTRDRKRETYRKFLEFGQNYTGPVMKMNPDKKTYINEVLKFFGKEEELLEVMRTVVLGQKAREIFNGQVVSDITGLVGKELGMFMAVLKPLTTFMSDRVVYMGKTRIEELIRKHFNEYKATNDHH